MRLVTDYNPQLIPRRTEWTADATLALTVSLSLMALALAIARRAPAVTFGVLVAAATYAPTSNIFFPSGVLLAERALYLAALAPAALLGWLVTRPLPVRTKRLLVIAVATILVVFGGRSLSRASEWKNTVTVVVEDLLEAPQNYRTHVRAGEMFAIGGDSTRALTHYMTAAELFLDPMIVRHSVPTALATGRVDVALRHARASYEEAPGHTLIAKLLAETYLARENLDSALAVSQHTLERSPGSLLANETHQALLETARSPEWQRHLAAARLHGVRYQFVAAGAHLDSVATTALSAAALGEFCWEVNATRPLMDALRPGMWDRMGRISEGHGSECLMDRARKLW